MLVKGVFENSKIDDAKSAEVVIRRELEARFGRNKIIKVTFSRAELVSGKSGEFWEAEGDIVMKAGLVSKQIKHFRYRIDSESKRTVGFEIS
jgi:hypothetical protein